MFATLHTNSAAKTIDRIIDIFPAGQQAQVRTMLSESIEGVVAQTLLPAKDGKGRVAALEVLVGVPALRNLIREDKTAQILSVIQTGAAARHAEPRPVAARPRHAGQAVARARR